MAVQFSLKFHEGWTPDMTFDLRCVPNRSQFVRLHDGIDRAAEDPQLLDLLFPVSTVSQVAAEAAGRRRVHMEWSPGINSEQREAVRQIVLGNDTSAPYLLQGPPGTGKVCMMQSGTVWRVVHWGAGRVPRDACLMSRKVAPYTPCKWRDLILATGQPPAGCGSAPSIDREGASLLG